MDNSTQSLVGGSFTIGKPTVVIGTAQGATGTVKITNAMDYCVDGAMYQKAATDNIPVNPITAQANLVSGLLTTCLYLLQINAAGTVSSVKGAEVLTADLASGAKVLQYPRPTDGNAPFAYFRVAVTTTYTYQFGVTALNATGVTTTYQDLFSVPSAPLTA